MRSVRIASAVLASAVLVAGLSACSSKSSGGDATKAGNPAAAAADKDPKVALLAAAAVMDKAGNAKLTVTGSTADDNGGGTLSWKPTQAVELTFKSDGQDETLRIFGDTMYMQAPAEMSTKLGKHWLKMDSKSAAAMEKGQDGNSDSPDMSMMSSMIQLFNPALELAAGAQGGKVTKVGSEQIDGAATVHYKAEISTDVMLAQLPSLTADQKTKMRTELNKDGKTSSTIDYWINAKSELVQMGGTDFNPSKGAGAAASTASTSTLKYSQIGTATVPVTPPAADTLDFAEFMKSMGAAG